MEKADHLFLFFESRQAVSRKYWRRLINSYCLLVILHLLIDLQPHNHHFLAVRPLQGSLLIDPLLQWWPPPGCLPLGLFHQGVPLLELFIDERKSAIDESQLYANTTFRLPLYKPRIEVIWYAYVVSNVTFVGVWIFVLKVNMLY